MMSCDLDHPFGQSKSASPPASCVLRVSSSVGCDEMPWHWVSPAQQKWNHLCIINPLSSTNPNDLHISTGMFFFISLFFYGDKWMLKVLTYLLFAFRQGCHFKTMHWLVIDQLRSLLKQMKSSCDFAFNMWFSMTPWSTKDSVLLPISLIAKLSLT